MSCPVMPCPALTCSALLCSALPCHALPCPHPMPIALPLPVSLPLPSLPSPHAFRSAPICVLRPVSPSCWALRSVLLCPSSYSAPSSCPPPCFALAPPSMLSCVMPFTPRCCSSCRSHQSLYVSSLSDPILLCIALHPVPFYETLISTYLPTTPHSTLDLSCTGCSCS